MPNEETFHDFSNVHALTGNLNAGSGASTGDVDTSKFESIEVKCHLGSANGATTVNGSDNTAFVKIEHASDSAGSPGTANSYAAVSSSDLVGSNVNSSGHIYTADSSGDLDKTIRDSYIGSNRFLRVTASGSGSKFDSNVIATVDIYKGAYRGPIATSDNA